MYDVQSAAAMQNVVDNAISIAMYFIIGFALSSSTGNAFLGTEVRPPTMRRHSSMQCRPVLHKENV